MTARPTLVLVAAFAATSAVARAADPARPPAGPVIVVRAARLYDGERTVLQKGATVIVEGKTIRAVGERLPSPSGAQVIDLGDATLLPGLIDVHAHLLIDPRQGEFRSALLSRTSARKALDGYHTARILLEAGFTSVRDPGDFDASYAHLAVRDAIAHGDLPGPRIFAAGRFITRTGGHYDQNWYAADLPAPMFAHVVDSADEMRRAVREEVKRGADWIKVAGTGGNASNTDIHQATFTEAELRAAVEETHRLGKKIAVHAHGLAGILQAARAGADSIEHGVYADDESLRLMARRGIYLVPTLYGPKASQLVASAGDHWIDEWKKERGSQAGMLARAIAAGVKIAFGTDSGVFPHGEGGRQLAMMVACGMSPLDALRSATSQAATLLGAEKQIGRLAAGFQADLIAVPGDLMKDLRAVERVSFVMKSGEVVKAPR
jgi:imidazolonepropionase-like amidohydrolase